MRYTVRHGCFETNSSSMHSIVLTNIEKESDKGEWYIHNGRTKIWSYDLSFGRSPFRLLTTMKDKICFAIASFSDDDEKIEEIREIAREIFGCELDIQTEKIEEYRRKDNKEYISSWDVEWIDDPNDHTKEIAIYKPDPSLEIEYTESEVIYSHIDHQSFGLLGGFLSKNNISLRDFITKAKYMVAIDGDEYCELENIMKSGIVDQTKIVEVYG